MAKKKLPIKCKAALMIPWDELVRFQGGLKTLGKTEYEQLRSAVLEDGFSFAIHAWKNKGKWWVLDGHQRLEVVAKLVTEEEYAPPSLPVVAVEAESYQQAKRKLLTGASNYGRGNAQGLADFISDVKFSPDHLLSVVTIQGIDMTDFAEQFMVTRKTEPESDDGDASNFGYQADPNIPASAAEGIKLVQLFYPAAEYEEVMAKASELQEKLKGEHISGTILEALRAVHKTHFPTAH